MKLLPLAVSPSPGAPIGIWAGQTQQPLPWESSPFYSATQTTSLRVEGAHTVLPSAVFPFPSAQTAKSGGVVRPVQCARGMQMTPIPPPPTATTTAMTKPVLFFEVCANTLLHTPSRSLSSPPEQQQPRTVLGPPISAPTHTTTGKLVSCGEWPFIVLPSSQATIGSEPTQDARTHYVCTPQSHTLPVAASLSRGDDSPPPSQGVPSSASHTQTRACSYNHPTPSHTLPVDTALSRGDSPLPPHGALNSEPHTQTGACSHYHPTPSNPTILARGSNSPNTPMLLVWSREGSPAIRLQQRLVWGTATAQTQGQTITGEVLSQTQRYTQTATQRNTITGRTETHSQAQTQGQITGEETLSHTESRAYTQTEAQGQTIRGEQALSQTQTRAETQAYTQAQTRAQTMGEKVSETQGYTQTQTRARGEIVPQTQAYTQRQTVAETLSQTQGYTQAHTRGQTMGDTVSHTQTQTVAEILSQAQTRSKTPTQPHVTLMPVYVVQGKGIISPPPLSVRLRPLAVVQAHNTHRERGATTATVLTPMSATRGVMHTQTQPHGPVFVVRRAVGTGAASSCTPSPLSHASVGGGQVCLRVCVCGWVCLCVCVGGWVGFVGWTCVCVCVCVRVCV